MKVSGNYNKHKNGVNLMIIVTATITAKKGERDKIISKSDALIESTRSERGCNSYSLYKSIENDDVLMMVEQWENLSDLEAHMQTEHFKAYGKDINDHLANDIDVSVYSADKV